MRTARVLLGALTLAACCRPAMAAFPPGFNLSIPADAPSLAEIETATNVTVPAAGSPGAGLTPLRDNSGDLLTLQSNDGAWAEAFTDAAGNTIIDYEWSMHDSQETVSLNTLAGEYPDDQPAYAESLAFARQVVSLTVSQGRSASQVYVTGFSEGGMLASFVGMRSGLPGVSFGSSGMPGYSAGGQPAGNFLSFLEAGDPIGQYGTDSYERASAVDASAHMDHYGTIIPLGTSGTEMQFFAAGIAGHTLVQWVDGTLDMTPDEYNALDATENELQTSYHNLAAYFPDANGLAAQFGY